MVEALKADNPALRQRAFGALVEAYWRPVYKYLRLRWRLLDANKERAYCAAIQSHKGATLAARTRYATHAASKRSRGATSLPCMA